MGAAKSSAFVAANTGFGALTAPEGRAQTVAPPPVSAAFHIMSPADTSSSSAARHPPDRSQRQPTASRPAKSAAAAIVVGALGVVFGDIGTSPLYTLRESFLHGSGMTPTPEHVLGVLSMLFWAVTLTVTIKYVTLIMRADNKGEGGVLALATLATQGLQRQEPQNPPRHHPARRDRPGAVLRRRHDHAGHDGDERRRGPSTSSRRPSRPTSCRCRWSSWSGCSSCSRAAPRASAGCSGRSCCCGSSCWACSASGRSSSIPAVLAAINPIYGIHLIADRGSASSGPSARSCWPSPAPRRSTPTWAISAASRSASPGSASSCRACCSTISARAR